MAALPPADTLQPVELADGVEIHLRVAGPGPRSVAWLVDLIIFILTLIAIIIVLGVLTSSLGDKTVQGILLLCMFVLGWFYNVFFEMGKRAATPGQRMMKLKVASVSGAPVRLPQSIIRNLLRVIDFMPGFYLFGLTCCLFTQRFQRLGDLVADTVVVYAEPVLVKKATHAVNALPLPPPVPLSRVEQAALLQFLERAPQWSDARKTELTDLLEPLTGETGIAGLRQACGMGLWIQKGGQE
ncbi:putative RDD family membrane protein YckC [Prosthecobacter fusiformis]|uniref:Putative RDD family membrane protein YckC n=1 Tax=Prosthecobacter fusiformis TaxID=48464 RepID=A0A4R7RIN7_9BACT|nr:RDD family protein [Prosthecobacter fusiformis]TDU63121.1 putative RDD family membrane protein YckC [Prosthecobacter fusiformis]